MARVFEAANGKIAIWEGEYDDAPLRDPFGNVARLKYHSDFDYIGIINARQLNVPLERRAGSASRPQFAETYDIFAHGLGYQPAVFGDVFMAGQWVPFSGSMPVQQMPEASQYARWIALGVTATHVTLSEYCICAGFNTSQIWTVYPAMILPVRIYVTDERLE